MGRVLGIFLVIVAAVAGATFAVLNAHPVEFNYYLGTRSIPLAVIVVLALAAGVLLGVLGSMMRMARLKRDASRLRRQVRTVEKEVVNLRPISTEDAD